MTEDFLHYIWRHKLFATPITTTDGQEVEVLQVGQHNSDAGPDFFNARVRIGDTVWAGNVEIHTNASDWYKHKHNTNKAYNNVILQIVHVADSQAVDTDGKNIPTAQITFDNRLFVNYNQLCAAQKQIPCTDYIAHANEFTTTHWLEKMAVERLESKSNNINQLLTRLNNNWEEAFYITLARNFGFGTNAQPFEQLATSLPLMCLAKHKDNLMQLEAMLFGQAGMLNETIENDEYYAKLQNEYRFLRHKFNLTPIEPHLWKFLRLRPVNFPTVRIAQFAQLIHRSSALFSKVLKAENTEELSQLFEVNASDYWTTHYNFGKTSRAQTKSLGNSAFQLIAVNTLAPFVFVYGSAHDNDTLREKALAWLEHLAPEDNKTVRLWNQIGIKTPNALFTQATLHLKNNYCDYNKCLQCGIGHHLIQKITL